MQSDPVQRLLTRLDAIGHALSTSEQALALIGLGSVGNEQARLDAFSDLDFFVIVEPGHKQRFIEHLDWISAVCPVAYAFQNTRDGYKLLFEDGIFCEFAVFEPDELEHIPFAAGRIVWKQAQVDSAVATPRMPVRPTESHPVEWLLGEALTNLYVGLGRCLRGEKLSGMRFIQQYAVDRVLELAPLIESEQPGISDPFAPERRFEHRFPGIALHLGEFMQGYDRYRESALAILLFLEHSFDVNPAMAAAIRRLCAHTSDPLHSL